MTLNITATASSGPPKIRKNASKKNKKSWRKNVDMTEVEEFLEEERFEERIGGSFSLKKDEDIFVLDVGGEDAKQKRRKKKEVKPLKCHSLLQGLPGVPDPKPMRNRTRSLEQRVNPVVKRKLARMVKEGFVSKKMRGARTNREEYLQRRKDTEADRSTRRRTKFDFDLWTEEVRPATQPNLLPKKPDGVDVDWLSPEAKTHTDLWTSTFIPKEKFLRSGKTGSLLPAVEVPHPGASYNPAVEDHQDLLWQATMIEFEKERQLKRIERATTAMYPSRDEAPTVKSYMLEMSEGIIELGGKVDEEEDEEEEEKEEEGDGKGNTKKGPKPKTRKQKRDLKKRGHEERKLKNLVKYKLKEVEVFRVKSIRKELKKEDEVTVERQKKKELNKIEKMKNPIQLSGYKYDAPDMEVKLTEELTGNLRNLKPEGSLLEDRYKSLQRRNIVETRVVQKAVSAKTKKVEKRSHKMGWEEDQLRKKKGGRGGVNKRKPKPIKSSTKPSNKTTVVLPRLQS